MKENNLQLIRPKTIDCRWLKLNIFRSKKPTLTMQFFIVLAADRTQNHWLYVHAQNSQYCANIELLQFCILQQFFKRLLN